MSASTDYISDFLLTVLVRQSKTADGSPWLEPLWLKAGESRGLAVFVSALDAEIYLQAVAATDGPAWRRVQLDDFDLLDHIKGQGGELHCHIIFGFSASMTGRLATRSGLPRPRLVTVTFDVSMDSLPPITSSSKNGFSNLCGRNGPS